MDLIFYLAFFLIQIDTALLPLPGAILQHIPYILAVHFKAEAFRARVGEKRTFSLSFLVIFIERFSRHHRAIKPLEDRLKAAR